jgi:hypothetical protein
MAWQRISSSSPQSVERSTLNDVRVMVFPHPGRLPVLLADVEGQNADLKLRFETCSFSDIDIIIIDEASISDR